jgi:hypothetical protein
MTPLGIIEFAVFGQAAESLPATQPIPRIGPAPDAAHQSGLQFDPIPASSFQRCGIADCFMGSGGNGVRKSWSDAPD